MKIFNKKITEIREYWRNPRINDKTVEALKKSIEKYGFNNPLCIDKDNVLVTGHARFRALKGMGYKTVPCIVLEAPDQVIKEYRIRDNQIHDLTLWDDQGLIDELKGIASFDDTINFFDGTLDEIFVGILETESLHLDMGVGVGLMDKEEATYHATEVFEKMEKPGIEHGEVIVKVPCPYCSHMNTIK